MELDCLPREILYGELWEGIHRLGRPLLGYKDVIKRDLRAALINTSAWEDIAEIHGDKVSKRGFQRRKRMLESRLHARERQGKNTQPSAHDSTRHVCVTCNRDCHSRIGLHSHTRSCPNPQRQPSPLRDKDATTAVQH